MALRCMIVDDDLMARKSIQNLCKKTELLSTVSVCENAEDAIKELNQNNEVDLVFLDIEMPGLTGFEFLDKVSYLPQIIFTTSKTEYAYEAFEYQVTDYLKKPIAFPRFMRAVEKAIEIQGRIDAYKEGSSDIYIREDGKFVRINFADIQFFENVGDYVRIKTVDSSHIIHSTLKGIDGKLRDPRFLKVHRSYIVNLDKIKDIEENTLVIEKTVIPISRANKPVLMSRLNFL